MDEQMIKKNNMKIFPLYKMFSWDLLFYYAVIFLFLTQVKGFNASEILLAESFYAIFRVVSQIFCINIVDCIGKQKSLLVANLLVCISIIILIICNKFLFLIIANLIQAIAYNIKGLCEPTILADSIPESSSSSKIYSKIDGKGSSLYFMFNAISSAITGYLYVLNPYIPLIICLIFCLISTVITLALNEPVNCLNKNKNTKTKGFVNYYKDIFSLFKQILKSNRLKSLLIFSSLFFGMISVYGTLRSSILVDINVSEQYFGILLAISGVVSSISSKNQNWFHNLFKNRLLTWFSLTLCASFVLTGLVVACNISFVASFTFVFITILLVSIIKGPYFTLTQRYFNSFSNPDVNSKIFAIKQLLESIVRFVLSLFTSYLLNITTTAYTFIILGLMFFIIFIFLLNYMKTRVGLKPEQYPKEDLIFTNTK